MAPAREIKQAKESKMLKHNLQTNPATVIDARASRSAGFVASALIAATLALTSCAGMNSTEQRTLSGGAIGATVGAVGTAVTGGCVACGAAIGGAVGAGAGYIYDQHEKSEHR
jgi:osmotically inducible lipoprotein OsmB